MATQFPGIDLSSLQALAQQFGPTDADKRYAQGMALLTAGAGLLGTRKGYEAQGISQGLLGGIQTYPTILKDQVAQRTQGMSQAMEALNMQLGIGKYNAALGLLNGGQQGAGAQGAASPINPLRATGALPSGAPSLPPGGIPQGNGVATYPLPGAPSQSVPPAPQAAPTVTDDTPSWASPNAQAAFALMGMPGLADIANKNYTTVVGRDGTITKGGKLWGHVNDQGIVQYQGGDPSKPIWLPNPPGMVAANAAQQGAIASAKESAKAQLNLVQYPIGNGQFAMIPQAEALARAAAQGGSAGQQQPPPQPGQQPPQSSTPPYSLKGNFSPADLERIRQDVTGEKPFEQQFALPPGYPVPPSGQPSMGQFQAPGRTAPPLVAGSSGQLNLPGAVGGAGSLGGPGVTASPLAIKAGEANIETGAKQAQDYNAANISIGAKNLQDLQAKKPIAIGMMSGLDQLERMDQQGVFNGPAQNQYMNAAIWLNSMFPGANIDVSKISDSQSYDSALKGIARSGLKSFGGRVTNAEFGAVLTSLPDRIATPEARANMRAQIGASALDELNQSQSAEQYWNPKTGLNGWAPPSPQTPNNYWQSRANIMHLQPAPGLNTTARYQVQQALKSGNPQFIKELILNGALK